MATENAGAAWHFEGEVGSFRIIGSGACTHLFDDAEVTAEMLIPARRTTRLWTSCLSIRNDVPGVDQRFPPGSSRNEIRGAGGVSELEDVGLTSGQSVPDASQKKAPEIHDY